MECTHNSYVTQIATKKEIISDLPPLTQADAPVVLATNRLDTSDTMETEAESCSECYLVENQRDLQFDTSDGSKKDNTTEALVYVVDESKQKMFSIECNVNNDNSEAVENAAKNDTTEVTNNTVGQLEYESSNGSDDTIDWIVNGGPSKREKSTSFGSSVNMVISEPFEITKPDTIDDSVNEMNHDNVRTKNHLAVVPYQSLLRTDTTIGHNDSAAAIKSNNGNSDVESDDSFGLVIDERHDSNSVGADNATLHVSDDESLRECENAEELDDDPVLIVNEVDAINSINLDDSLSIPNDDKNLTEGGMEIVKVAVQSSDTANIFDKLRHKEITKKKSFRESLSVSDDEIVTSGRYGAQVKCEDKSELVTSFSFRIENIRSTGTEISKTTEVNVDAVVEVS